jgi:hypothetical protein
VTILPPMFSHVVIFWTKPEIPSAADDLLAGIDRYLTGIPGIVQIHAGRMVPSHRPVVDQSYQVALNVIFTDKQAHDDYQVHASHVAFVEEVFKKVCARATIFDFA